MFFNKINKTKIIQSFFSSEKCVTSHQRQKVTVFMDSKKLRISNFEKWILDVIFVLFRKSHLYNPVSEVFVLIEQSTIFSVNCRVFLSFVFNELYSFSQNFDLFNPHKCLNFSCRNSFIFVQKRMTRQQQQTTTRLKGFSPQRGLIFLLTLVLIN